MMMNKTTRILTVGLTVAGLLCGCAQTHQSTSSLPVSVSTSDTQDTASATQTNASAGPLDPAVLFSSRDKETGYEASEAVAIALNGTSAACEGQGVLIEGSTVTIGAEGVYLLSGSLTNGQVIVDAPKTDKVQLVLDGVQINCDTSAAIYVRQADKVFVTLAHGSENSLSNSAEFVAIDENGIDAVLFAKDDITLNGDGALTVSAVYGHGIVGKDEVAITSGSYTVTAAEHGISAKESLQILDGSFTMTSGKDGFHSEDKDDATMGQLYIGGGSYTVDAKGDAFDAATILQVDGGTFDLKAGGGSVNTPSEETSSKGLKAGGMLQVGGGSFTIDTADDAVHTNADLNLLDGSFKISSGDDGIHADANLTISGGTVNIAKSYEGVEGQSILLTGGEVNLVASDDGFNAAGGNDGSSLTERTGRNSFAANSNCSIEISGGKLTIDAGGDGIDSNGSLTISGGEVYVNGPADRGNSALDCDGSAQITGGLVVAVGATGMAQGFSTDSTQGWILSSLSAAQTGAVSLTSEGKTIAAYTPTKQYGSVLVSAPEIQKGESYTLTAGSETQEITLTESYYSSGGAGGFGGRGGGMIPPDGSIPPEGAQRPDKATRRAPVTSETSSIAATA